MASLLDTISDSIKDLTSSLRSAGGGSRIAGLDIGASSIKAVQIERQGGKLQLETYGSVATGVYAEGVAGQIPDLSQEQSIQVIKDLITNGNITATEFVVSLQSQASLVFILKLPNVPDKDLGAMVQNEARRYIPIPLEEVAIDWWPLPTSESGQENPKREVLVAAIRKDTLEAYQTLLKEAGITVKAFEIEVFSLARASLHHDIAPVALVDFGASGTRVSVVQYGVVKYFHSINRGGYYITESIARSMQIPFNQAEDFKVAMGLRPQDDARMAAVHDSISSSVAMILTEVTNAIRAFQTENQLVVEKIVISGGGAKLLGLKDMLAQQMRIPVTTADPFTKVDNPKFMNDILAQVGPDFTIATGLAMQQL